VLKLALSYVTVRLKNRWLLIPMSVFIFLGRITRFGHVWIEIQLAITLLVLTMLWPKLDMTTGKSDAPISETEK
jgi:hypothetical protein